MSDGKAATSDTFKLGGTREIHRLSFDAIWGPPTNRNGCLGARRRPPELRVNFIDTADACGPNISEPLIGEALHHYSEMVIAIQGGLVGTGPEQWIPVGRPKYLLRQLHKSLRQLGVEQLTRWQLHHLDPKVPRNEQFDAIKSLLDQGLIAHAGPSEVSVDDIEVASKRFAAATVQNRCNLIDRTREDVLDYCGSKGVGFIPCFTLAAGDLSKPGSVLDTMANKYDASPSQMALAWVLKRSSVMFPIPGTSKVTHLEENMAAVDITLSDAAFEALNEAGKAAN